MSIQSNEFLAIIAAASNNVLMLAALHWSPWSFHLGRPLKRYEAFVSGCLSILFSFGLWAILTGNYTIWVILVVLMMILHWPLWLVGFTQKISHIAAYILASLPIVVLFIGWTIWTGIVVAGLCLIILYAAGGIATAGFYYLDKIGMSEHNSRNDK